MEFFEVIKKRRSIRKFNNTPVNPEMIEKALEAAVIAPNSSNTQTWDFHWIKNKDLKAKVVTACMSQSAARTAQELIVITADPANWRRSHKPLVNFVNEVKAPKLVIAYYEKLIPFGYRWGFLNCLAPLKYLISLTLFFKPFSRGPFTKRGLQEVAIKSAALACENFVLALTAQGLSSCMMEGFDDWRLRRLLKIRQSAKVVMVIGIGYEGERATWGPQFRIPTEQVVTIYE